MGQSEPTRNLALELVRGWLEPCARPLASRLALLATEVVTIIYFCKLIKGRL